MNMINQARSMRNSGRNGEFKRDRSETAVAPKPDLVVIRTYQRGVDADLAKSVLEASGIPSMIRGDQGRRYYYGYGLALKTGIELLVWAEDADDAEKILNLDVTDNGGDPND
jgi:Putative prokaryotic signal transducing protein